MAASKKPNSISRRSVLAGGVGALSAFAIPNIAFGAVASPIVKIARTRPTESTLAKFLCESVHDKMAANLDATMESAEFAQADLKLAMHHTKCPGCNEHIHPTQSFDAFNLGAQA